MARVSWLDWFMNQREGSLLLNINRSVVAQIVQDPQIKDLLPQWEGAYEVMMSRPRREDANETHAKTLYGLIHQRYLRTQEGMEQMIEKMEMAKMPQCPRTLCKGSFCLPCGITDNFFVDSVKWFCPRCSDFYDIPMPVSIDGGYFGKQWIHFLMHDHSNLLPSEPARPFIPEVFGFKVFLPDSRTPGK